LRKEAEQVAKKATLASNKTAITMEKKKG